MAAAGNLLLIAAVAAVSLIAASDARPCGHAQTLLISFSSVSRPNPDPTNPAPLTTTVVTVLRVRRLGPHQIRRHEALPAAAATEVSSSSVQDRAKDILVVVSGLLFGFGCGALTAASMYLVWSLLASMLIGSRRRRRLHLHPIRSNSRLYEEQETTGGNVSPSSSAWRLTLPRDPIGCQVLRIDGQLNGTTLRREFLFPKLEVAFRLPYPRLHALIQLFFLDGIGLCFGRLTAAEFVVRPLLNEILDNYCSAESISESTLCDV